MGKKGGSGSAGPTQVGIPAGTYAGAQNEAGLGQYASSILDPIASMTNWASNIATGGAATPVGSFAQNASVSGPNISYGKRDHEWATSFDPNTGYVTYTNVRTPSQTQQEFIGNTGNSNEQLNALPPDVRAQWLKDYQQRQNAKQWGQTGSAPGGQKDTTSTYGPQLGLAWQDIQQQQQNIGQMTPIEAQTRALTDKASAQSDQLYTQGEKMLTEATGGSGLFPSQQAMIDLAKQTSETDLAAQMSGMGLTKSTQAAELKGQADMTAAAAGGSLVQGNITAAQQQITLAQASQKIAQGGVALQVGEQQAVQQELASIATQSEAFQQNMWTEAMQGYGMLGQMITTAGNSYGQSLSGYANMISAENQSAANATQLAGQANSAAASGASSLVGVLGSVLGSTGSSGGLLGAAGSAIGSIFGTAGAGAVGGAASAAVGGSAAAAGGAAAGGSAIGGALSALGALFCWVARVCYGANNPKWIKFRSWMNEFAPWWLFTLYAMHGEAFAERIRHKPLHKFLVRCVLDAILAFHALCCRMQSQKCHLPQSVIKRRVI